MNHDRTRMAALVATAALLAACSGGAGTQPARPVSSAAAATAQATPNTTLVGDFDVGGRTMHLVCVGPVDTGRPTVIFEAGLGGDLTVWAPVLTPLSATERGCSYDRAGVGMSEPADGPRTTADQVSDLRALLKAADVKPPYLLVGHSSGAYNVLVHGDAFPDEVAGAILADPRPPMASARFLDLLPAETAGESDLIHEYRDGYLNWERDPSGNPEGLNLADSAIEAEAATGFGDRPIVVLSAGDAELDGSDLEAALAGQFAGVWTELQQELATRSSRGQFEVVDRSTHDMTFDRPDAIIEAIQATVASMGG